MPYLRLRDLRDQRLLEFETEVIRLGRHPDSELAIAGEGAQVVSGAHARLVHRDGGWWVEDVGGRNGTFVDGRRIEPGSPFRLRKAAIIGLGERGPRFQIDALERHQVEATVLEVPEGPAATLIEESAAVGPDDKTVPMRGLDTAPPTPPPPPTAPSPASPAAPASPTGPAVPAPPPPGPGRAPAPLTIFVVNRATGERFEGTGGRIRVGRGRECELRPVDPGDTSVSRVHCEIVLKPDGQVVVRDAQSRNGTIVNGRRLAGEHPLERGDRIKLGDAGPELAVETMLKPVSGAATPPAEKPAPAPPPAAVPPPASPPAATPPPRRSFAGKGRTVFIKELVEATERKSASRVRAIAWTFVVLLAAAVGGLYWYADRQSKRTEAELESQRRALVEQQRRADSIQAGALAEVQQLSLALDQARRGSAPAAVVDSLRTALQSAQDRTTQLEAALERARREMTAQLAAGDSLRRAAQGEIERLRSELQRTAAAGVSAGMLDSLRGAMREAEERAAEIEAGLRAVRGADLAHIAQGNQAAVGLVSTFAPDGIYDGSGFVISRSGYFITNRHVALPGGQRPDSLFVTMADQRTMNRATLIAVAPPDGPDLAVLRIRTYTGPSVTRIDWDGNGVRQGEPAALIGFPAGVAAALDRTRTVRTSMSAGIFSKVTPDLIQFDGFTIGGSSGSPVFNANGEVVAVHAAGLREAAGLGFTVPVRLVIPLFPDSVRTEVVN